VTCATRRPRRCSTRTLGGAAKFRLAGTARLLRAGRVVARGHAREGLIRVSGRRRVPAGRYTLVVRGLDDRGRLRTQRGRVVVR
jgi:hypothetical protein